MTFIYVKLELNHRPFSDCGEAELRLLQLVNQIIAFHLRHRLRHSAESIKVAVGIYGVEDIMSTDCCIDRLNQHT